VVSELDLVVVRTYLNNFEAEIDRTTLEAAGLLSMIRSDDCGGLRPHLWMGGIELLVRSEDVTRATEILDAAGQILVLDEPDDLPEGEDED
jgi:hypothetical protein